MALEEVCNVEYGTRVVQKRDGGKGYPVYGGGGETFEMDRFNREDRLVIARFGMSEECTRFVAGKFFLNDSGLTVSPKNGKIDQRYLDYQMLARNSNIYALGKGAAQKNLDVPVFRTMPLFVPKDISEQQQIVTLLDEAFEGIATAKANTQKNLQNSRALFESHLTSTFECRDWESRSIEDVCDEIFAGGDAPKNNISLEKNESHNIPIYANAVKDKGLYGYTNVSRVNRPSLTISARGSGTGHTEIRFDQYLPIVRLIVLIPNPSLINLEFLKYAVDNMEILRSGSAIPQLTVPMIKEYKLPLPTIEEQNEIVEKLSIMQGQTQRLTQIYQQKIAALDEIKRALLHKAFSGEL